jgi:hypothetical protein
MKLHYQLICKTCCFFYSKLLIQLYWITYYVESLTGGSYHNSNGPVTLSAHCYYDLSSNGRGDALSPVATMIHQNSEANNKNNYHHHPSKVSTKS